MDTKMKLQKSLPPLVEGKVHDYLKLVIDEVIWSKRNFGEIRVFVTWWGETNSSEFRPADITKNVIRLMQETTEVYAIRTNINLFEEYIKNCETLELVVVSEETNIVIGRSQITDLSEIFKCKPYFRYIPIITNCGNKIGEIHISMKLEHITKSFNMQLKTYKYEKDQVVDNTLLSTINDLKNQHDIKSNRYTISKKIEPEESEIYKSILKLKRTELQEPVNKFSAEVTDKLVAQVVARAQRLRGALLKETYEEDELTFSDSSVDNSLQTHISTEDVKLYECVLDKDTSSDESKTLCTLSLTDLASNSLKASRYDNKNVINNTPSIKIGSLIDDAVLEKKVSVDLKDAGLFNFVNYIRINVGSFTLSPAGYRRVKSSLLSYNDSISFSATYFIQYDMTFDYIKESEKKRENGKKPIRICSKKQIKQVIYFDHNSTYKVPKMKYYTEQFIQFKIFVRHFNKKSLIELGNATVYISDITKCENQKFAQQLTVINKGIKIGELNVIIELDSDSNHFEKHIDNLISTKENIANLEINTNERNKIVVKNQVKRSNEVSSVSAGVVDSSNTDSDSATIKSVPQFITENIYNKSVGIKTNEDKIEDKILLHGLIYIAEGQVLSESNTYLICRAFWRENKTRSQICNNTKHPFYQFCQLVPLIYDSDLLERIKDNYIIIEVYFRKNNIDNLLGLTKLSVHQLYVAYRDPRILPHLLLSKYPVVSVDGWVSIIDPVTGQSCGQLLALVALGTAEQITLLEVSRGLRPMGTISQIVHSEEFSDCKKYSQNMQQSCNTRESQLNKMTFSQDHSEIPTVNMVDGELYVLSSKTEDYPTDVTTVKEFKFNEESQEKTLSSKYSNIHDTDDHLIQVLNVNKNNIDQAAQTEISLEGKSQTNTEKRTCMNELNFNNGSDESDNNSTRQHFHLTRETYRSVGVGAEYNEEIDQQLSSNHSNTTFELPTVIHTENELTNSTCSQATFRAIVEIECALHLPKIEKVDETIEPCTYVSFQANKSDHTKHFNSYMITNVFPHSCNPKWNWKCDTELSTELLLHGEKRLILKIWHILHSDVNMQINMERDVVIGFSAIDLSVLISGFPTVSGWFHIMDFTGKCNGQIKICVTPLDNLSLFGKPISMLNTTQLPICSTSQLSWVSLHTGTYSGNMERNNTNYTLSTLMQEEDKSVHSDNQSNSSITCTGLEDVSMSFLSLSLKQKLTELDEITKRLESRLRDVTNTAFEDDLENEFDPNEPNSDNENNDYKIATSVVSTATTDNNSRIFPVNKKSLYITETKETENENENISDKTDIKNCSSQTYIDCNKAITCEIMKPNFSEISNCYNKMTVSNNNCKIEQQSKYLMQNNATFDNTFTDYPERGTKTHINYLLDKLSLHFPAQTYLTKTVPVKKSVTSLLTNLQSSTNNVQDNNKCNQGLKMCTVPTQTDDVQKQTIKKSVTDTEFDTCNKNSPEVSVQSEITNKMSTVIREELIAEENSNTSKCDELTTYLVTSNIRHMDLNDIFNPLLYKHLVPDLHYSNASPEDEAIKQLDNRYSKVFSTSISNRLNNVHNLVETNMSLENTEFCRTTPSGVSENIDDSIDLTILHKANYNDLLASNSTESTTTISIEKSLMESVDSEIVENGDSTSSETSVLVLSRQAPDGGNPVEDTRKPLIVQQKDEVQYSSSSIL